VPGVKGPCSGHKCAESASEWSSSVKSTGTTELLDLSDEEIILDGLAKLFFTRSVPVRNCWDMSLAAAS
jgi:hypothetical protein